MKLLPFFVIIPLSAAFLIAVFGKRTKYTGDTITNLTTLLLLVFSVNVSFLVKSGGVLVYKMGGWMPPIGIGLVADGLTALMLVTVSLVTFLVTIYAISYMRSYTDKWKFQSLFMLMLAGMNGVIISGDFFNLYVFLEIASISGYALVAFGIEPESLEA
ncbi:MAG: NADH/ubiquinone/plastoquinone (complex I), partial [Candidatus Omnitrophica bacterium]|nr:NADH/ubiquinone/plastoquinone (complex I) [Candidatus Omnitrophota bacterium]